MQILLTKTNSVLSYAIRWFIKDKNIKWKDVPGHAAIRFGGLESNWIIQSHRNGVEPSWWPYFKTKNTIVAAYEIVGVDEEVLGLIIEQFIGKVIAHGYDFSAIAGFILGQLKKKFSGKSQAHNAFASDRRFFCSELVVRMLQFYDEKTGRKLIEDMDASAVSPLDLMRAMDKSRFFKKVTI